MSRFYHFSIVSAVGVSSFLVGRYFEKPNGFNILNKDFYPAVSAKSLAVVDEPLVNIPYNDKANSLDNKTARVGQVFIF